MRPIAPAHGRMFTAGEAAQYLGTTVSFVRGLITRGELAAIRNPRGRLTGVFEADCDAWVEKRRRATVPVRPRLSVDARVEALMPTARRFA